MTSSLEMELWLRPCDVPKPKHLLPASWGYMWWLWLSSCTPWKLLPLPVGACLGSDTDSMLDHVVKMQDPRATPTLVRPHVEVKLSVAERPSVQTTTVTTLVPILWGSIL